MLTVAISKLRRIHESRGAILEADTAQYTLLTPTIHVQLYMSDAGG